MTPLKKVMAFLVLFILSISVYAQAGPVPDTGQTQSYTDTFGEDSDYTINPQSYTKLDEQGNALPDSATSWVMVKDNVTGLIWQKETTGPMNWEDAKSYCEGISLGGYSDWRLPTVKELSYIVNSGRSNPSINTDYFPNTLLPNYWSSTTNASGSGLACYVYFGSGYVSHYGKSNSYYVRAVRGGQSGSFDNLIIGDGTVTDSATGLMWQQATTGPMTWEEAISYCEDLVLGGRGDWRLPNRNELQSLVDYAKYAPAIDITAFPGTMSSNYWSSTTYAYYSVYAWSVSFDSGYVSPDDSKSNSYYVRAVRGGQSGSFDDLEICDGIDNDGNGLVDEEGAAGCRIYYKDADQDRHGVEGDSRCLCSPDVQGAYTALYAGDPNDADPNILGTILKGHLYLPKGWSMISLPVAPDDASAATIFPGALAIYRYERQKGYKRVTAGDSLETGRGYWILLSEGKTFTLTGAPIEGYTRTVDEGGWAMIGGCSHPASASSTGCSIAVIYGYTPEDGYQRVSSENLDRGKGYWILLNNVGEQADLRVEGME